MNLRYSLKLNLSGANLSGGGMLWRLAAAAAGRLNPTITSALVASIPETPLLPRFSVRILSLPLK